MRTCVWVMLLAGALVLTGCLGINAPQVPHPAAPALLVDYQRSGGIAGVNDRLVIFDNGVTLVSNRTTGREILLSQSDLEQISAICDAAQFPMLEGNYSRRGTDLMQYGITYQGRTVNTEDTAIPPTLEPVIEEMNRVLSNGLTSRQAYLPLPRIAR